jgi:hypothetical protein
LPLGNNGQGVDIGGEVGGIVGGTITAVGGTIGVGGALEIGGTTEFGRLVGVVTGEIEGGTSIVMVGRLVNVLTGFLILPIGNIKKPVASDSNNQPLMLSDIRCTFQNIDPLLHAGPSMTNK